MSTFTRIVALVIGALLIAFSFFWIPSVSVPVYRTGTLVDYLLAAEMFLAIHGGVFLGVLVYWISRMRSGRNLSPRGIFKAGFLAELCLSATFVLGSGVYGLITFGSLEKGVGNLWGAVLILWLILGALVAAGVALLCYGFLGHRT